MSQLSKIAVLMNLAILTGCASAEITKRTYQPQPGGVVKYDDSWMMGEKSRAKALDKANELCFNRGYTINSESSGNELGPVTSSTNASGQMTVSQSSSKFVYIDFTCKQ